jgi:rod shape-determining protein MreD
MIAGTIGGLAQDALSSGVLGVDGLAKTIIGASAGALGARFVVTRPLARTLVVAAATIVHRVTLAGLHAVIDQRWSGAPWRAILGETFVNALCGYLVFQAADVLPRSMQQRRSRSRTPFARREW